MAKKRRQKGKIRFEPSAALVIDGKTEKWYFQMLQRHEKSLYLQLKPEIPQKKNLEKQYELVSKLAGLEYEFVFWVVDFDEIMKQTREAQRNSKPALSRMIEYKEELEKEYKNVFVIINSPCLEFWISLHYVCTTKHLTDCKSAIRDLRKKLPDYEKTEKYYCNKDNDIYQRLRDKLDTAIQNAEISGGFDKESPYRGVSEMNVFFKTIGLDKQR